MLGSWVLPQAWDPAYVVLGRAATSPAGPTPVRVWRVGDGGGRRNHGRFHGNGVVSSVTTG